MSFCYSPWTNFDITPGGDIKPCCKFRTEFYDEQFNVQHDDLNSYVNSKFLSGIKQELLQGGIPQGCERCKIEEENNIESKRQLDYQRWKEHYDNYDINNDKFITASVAFGNTCNLKCITCSPYASSLWHKEYLQIHNKDVPNVRYYREDFVTNLTTQAPGLIHLDLPGGEPLISGVPEQQKLLMHYVETGQAKNMSLHYNTNVTTYPDDSWWDIWRHFKEIDMQLSIDGVETRYEYIRYPASWETLVDHVSRYQSQNSHNLRLSISHTVSAYNIYYLNEFFTWCADMGLPRPWCGRVHNPMYMRPSVWPAHVKDKILTKLRTSLFDDVHTWANLIESTDDSIHFADFKNYLHKHDEYRRLDFRKVFPDLAEFV
jgi:MoaA/NifB/PqqE/SkfB family radical SAM enzyme